MDCSWASGQGALRHLSLQLGDFALLRNWNRGSPGLEAPRSWPSLLQHSLHIVLVVFLFSAVTLIDAPREAQAVNLAGLLIPSVTFLASLANREPQGLFKVSCLELCALSQLTHRGNTSLTSWVGWVCALEGSPSKSPRVPRMLKGVIVTFAKWCVLYWLLMRHVFQENTVLRTEW